MMMTPEQAALKAQHQCDALRDFLDRAARDGQRIDTVERELSRQLLGLGHSLEMLPGLKLRTRTLGHMSREVAGYAPAFQDALPLPPPEAEGPLLVATADGQGVPMRRPPQDGPRPHHRRTKGEKANTKPM